MRNLLTKFWAKLLAVFLLLAFALVAVASAVGVYACAEESVYLDGGTTLRRDALQALANRWSRDAQLFYTEYVDAQAGGWELDDSWAERFSEANTNFFFTVSDEDGTELFASYAAPYQTHCETWFSTNEAGEALSEERQTFSSAAQRQVYLEELQRQYQVYESSQWEEDDADGTLYCLYVYYGPRVDLKLDGYIRSDLTAQDSIAEAMRWVERLIALRYGLMWIGGFAAVGAVLALVFLLAAAGRREGEEGIHLTWFDRIPLDLLVVAVLAPTMLGLFNFMNDASGYGAAVGGALLCVLLLLLLLALLMSFAARAKAGTLWKNNVIYMVLRLLWRLVRRLWNGLRDLVRALPLCWRTLLLWALLSLVELIALVNSFGGGDLFGLWLVEKLVLTPLLLFAVIAMQRLQKGAARIAAGEIGYTIDLTRMYGAFRRHGEYLNSIGDGLQTAVDERVRSERMKAELITNVSHDIKTPLTSIVNYVDLLQKEPLESAAAREYTQVLARQAQRLKKLTEDLVEASKASTGNIAVHAAPTDVNLLLSQAAGEFADRFSERRLETVLTVSPEQPEIMADGQLLWRVFSNLMSNIYKYAMEGTRVYLAAELRGDRVDATFRNISREALNLTGEELMERFVRGDRARSGEGSGLGLSIARSLTELQGGAFEITVDGDLFKVTVSFPLLLDV